MPCSAEVDRPSTQIPRDWRFWLMALYAAPAYFYKKSKGVFKAAPADVLQQALTAIERKKQQEAQIAAWSQELQEGSLPEGVAAELKRAVW